MTEEALVKSFLGARQQLGSVAWGIVRNYHTAEDILQDVLVKALERKEQFEEESYLLAWARVACRNAAIDLCRQTSNRKNLLDAAALDALDADLSEQAAEALDRRVDALAECLNRLPKKTRSIIEERYKAGQSVETIAEKWGRSLDAIYQTISRTHRKLRDCVEHRITSS